MNIQEFKNYLNEKDKKYVIFDFDQTLATLLIDWSTWGEKMKEIFSSYGIDFDSRKSEYSKYAEIQNYCIEKYGDEAEKIFLEMNHRHEKEYYRGYDLLPATLPILDSIKNNAKLYLWTSNSARTIAPILEELKIDKLFSGIITRNDVRYIKPNPEGFFLIYDKNIPKSQYLFIGDSLADIGAGINSGIDFINIAEFKL
ncbi:MAG: HAD family phosphatase [Candidatus Moraniibacteriota bacterium]